MAINNRFSTVLHVFQIVVGERQTFIRRQNQNFTKSRDDARNERDARARYLPSFSLMRDFVSISSLKLTTNHYIRKTVCVHRCHTGDCSVIKIKDNVCYTRIILPSELHFIAGTILKL